jgi:large subunit ribosomal protein L22
MYRIHLLVFSASLFNPVTWIKEKLGPTVKEAPSEEKIQEAKDQAKKEGTASLFEEVRTVVPPKLAPKNILQKRASGSHKKKKKPDSVCTFVSSQMRF